MEHDGFKHNTTGGSPATSRLRAGLRVMLAADGRALHNLLTNEHLAYEDNCYGGWEHGGGNERKTAPIPIAQEYQLSPNPTEGNLLLTQKLKDAQPVSISIYNALGAVVFKVQKSFVSKGILLQVGQFAPGIYNLVITNSAKASTLRFVKR